MFNVVFNNRDDHGKNLSFRMGADRRWRLAPCYDLTYNEGPGGEHQMDVCGEGRRITRAHLLRRVVEQAQQFTAFAACAPIRQQTVKRIRASIQANIAALSKAA